MLAVICVHQHVHNKWKDWTLLHVSATNCHTQGGVIRGISDINTSVSQIQCCTCIKYTKWQLWVQNCNTAPSHTGHISTILQYSSFPHRTHQYITTIQLLPTQDTSVQYYYTSPSHTGHISTIPQYSSFPHRTHQYNTTIQLIPTRTHQYNTTIQLLPTQDTSVQYYNTAPSHTGHISTILQYSFFPHRTHQYTPHILVILYHKLGH